MEEKDKIFDTYEDIHECTQCGRWWTDQCDGVPEGSERPCKSFLAVRKVKIPEEISSLKADMKCVKVSEFILWLMIVLHAVSHLMGG